MFFYQLKHAFKLSSSCRLFHGKNRRYYSDQSDKDEAKLKIVFFGTGMAEFIFRILNY